MIKNKVTIVRLYLFRSLAAGKIATLLRLHNHFIGSIGAKIKKGNFKQMKYPSEKLTNYN